MLQPGDIIPDFSLPDQDGKTVTLSERLKNGPVLVFFYPVAGTFGCTLQACGFRDSFDEFTGLGISVIGISRDEAKDQKQFALHNQLPFDLLCDTDSSVHALFGIRPGDQPGPLRSTFIIGPGRKVLFAYASRFMFYKHARMAKKFLISQLSGGGN